MSRLRVRMELNRGGAGVPLHKLASVVDEAQKFFHMLSEDVHIDSNLGQWLGLDFENKSLNFTAEFVGPVSPEQVRQFYAAFDGVTPLRRATIAQFARIAGAIEEDELVGFGLYQSDQETEPSEWRSLSKRDAVRIASEIQLLLERTEDGAAESRLPTALDPTEAANLFKERREHGGLAERVSRLESEVGRHGGAIETLRGTTANTEQNLQKLLVAVDAFCDKASRQMERLPAPELGAPRRFRWGIPAAVVGALGIVTVILLSRGPSVTRPAETRVQAAEPAAIEAPAAEPKAVEPKVAEPKTAEPAPAAAVHVAMLAVEPTWVAVYVEDKQTIAKLLNTGERTRVESAHKIRVRLGNAGGVEILANGKPVGPVGPKGQARTVEFTAEGFHIASVK